MSAEGDMLYSKDLFLLTLKGTISVHFMDGYTLEGEFAAQDAFNFFLIIDGKPFMIPRNQIRYIKGGYGQQIEKDTSRETFMRAEPLPMDTLKTELPEADEMAMPMGISAEEAEAEVAVVDDGSTFVIEPGMGDFVSGEFVADVEEAGEPALAIDDLEDTGQTFVLEDTADLSGELEKIAAAEADLEEDTLVLARQEEEEEIAPQLVCTAGPHAGEQFELKGEVITLGRAKDNNISLPNDKEISRRHALIVREAGGFMIQDQNSLNGTFVNDQPVEASRDLEDGDVILIGVSELRYQEQAE